MWSGGSRARTPRAVRASLCSIIGEAAPGSGSFPRGAGALSRRPRRSRSALATLHVRQTRSFPRGAPNSARASVSVCVAGPRAGAGAAGFV